MTKTEKRTQFEKQLKKLLAKFDVELTIEDEIIVADFNLDETLEDGCYIEAIKFGLYVEGTK